MNVLVYLGATMPSRAIYVDAVSQLGEGLAKSGHTLVFGGSNEGTMTVLADAVMHNGGKAIGVFTKALPMDLLYPGLTETIITEDIAERKAKMYSLADAIVAMPGGYGTWDELFNALELAKIDRIHKRPVKPIAMLNLNGYYDGVQTLVERSIQDGYTTQRYAKLLYSAPTVQALMDWLK